MLQIILVDKYYLQDSSLWIVNSTEGAVMYDPPAYLWALTIAGVIAMLAATCVVLFRGAARASLGRGRATLLAGGAAVVLGGWCAASAVIAGHGWYHTQLGHSVPWLPVAVMGFLGLL